jgi:RimJ/RimL family protein N-acetyltransferase
MGYLVQSDALKAYAFCLKYIRINRTPQQKGIIQTKDGEIVAGIVYDEFNGSNLFIHVAAKPNTRWLTRELLYWAFHYPFVQLGATRLTAWVTADNLASRQFVEHLGFKLEATLKDATPTGDVLLYVMFRKDCRYV